MTEKRKYERVPLRLEAQWNGLARNYPAVTTDVSFGGCYIESIDDVNVGDILNLQLTLPSKRILPLQGEVRYHHPTIGFGIRFVEVSALQQGVLTSLLRQDGMKNGIVERMRNTASANHALAAA